MLFLMVFGRFPEKFSLGIFFYLILILILFAYKRKAWGQFGASKLKGTIPAIS